MKNSVHESYCEKFKIFIDIDSYFAAIWGREEINHKNHKLKASYKSDKDTKCSISYINNN